MLPPQRLYEAAEGSSWGRFVGKKGERTSKNKKGRKAKGRSLRRKSGLFLPPFPCFLSPSFPNSFLPCQGRNSCAAAVAAAAAAALTTLIAVDRK